MPPRSEVARRLFSLHGDPVRVPEGIDTLTKGNDAHLLEFNYPIHRDNVPVGEVRGFYVPSEKTAYISNIGNERRLPDGSTHVTHPDFGPNDIGPAEMRLLLRDFKEKMPEDFTTLSGHRISGVRGANQVENDFVRVPVPEKYAEGGQVGKSDDDGYYLEQLSNEVKHFAPQPQPETIKDVGARYDAQPGPHKGEPSVPARMFAGNMFGQYASLDDKGRLGINLDRPPSMFYDAVSLPSIVHDFGPDSYITKAGDKAKAIHDATADMLKVPHEPRSTMESLASAGGMMAGQLPVPAGSIKGPIAAGIRALPEIGKGALSVAHSVLSPASEFLVPLIHPKAANYAIGTGVGTMAQDIVHSQDPHYHSGVLSWANSDSRLPRNPTRRPGERVTARPHGPVGDE